MVHNEPSMVDKVGPDKPDKLEGARQLRDSGLFRGALAALDRLSSEFSDRWSTKVFRAELLERVGRAKEASTLIQRAIASRALMPSDRSLCEFVLARIALQQGYV